MGGMSIWHWVIVLVVVVLIFGTKRLKNVGKDVGEAVKGFVVLKAGANSGAAELQAHVKDKRGAPWSPKTIDFVETIPVTGLGKIDRKALGSERRALFGEPS